MNAVPMHHLAWDTGHIEESVCGLELARRSCSATSLPRLGRRAPASRSTSWGTRRCTTRSAAAGIERVRRRLAPVLGGLRPGRLLDVGAGTGAFYGSVLLSRSGQYHLLRGDLVGRASPGHE